VGPTPGRGDEGRGHGLALHGAMLAVIGGTLRVEGEAGRGLRVTLRVPLVAATAEK